MYGDGCYLDMVVIVSQCTQVVIHYVGRLKLMLYANYISIKNKQEKKCCLYDPHPVLEFSTIHSKEPLGHSPPSA